MESCENKVHFLMAFSVLLSRFPLGSLLNCLQGKANTISFLNYITRWIPKIEHIKYKMMK